MQISASAIHEIRMVIQHGMRLAKRVNRSKPTPSQPTLLCADCLWEKKLIPNAPITIVRGNAVCRQHLS